MAHEVQVPISEQVKQPYNSSGILHKGNLGIISLSPHWKYRVDNLLRNSSLVYRCHIYFDRHFPNIQLSIYTTLNIYCHLLSNTESLLVALVRTLVKNQALFLDVWWAVYCSIQIRRGNGLSIITCMRHTSYIDIHNSIIHSASMFMARIWVYIFNINT